MPQLPDNIKEMTKWPHTPTQQRLTDAAKYYQQACQTTAPVLLINTEGMSPNQANRLFTAASDRIEVEIFLDEHDWSEWALETFQKETDPLNETFERRMALIASIAAEGDGEDTMGFAIMTKNSPHAKEPGQVAIGFAKLLRSTNWMGLCKLLEQAAGTHAIVVESRKHPGRIGHTICIPQNNIAPENNPSPPFSRIPLPGGKELTRILRYHGVTRTKLNPAP